MNLFLKLLERMTGRKSQRSTMDASTMSNDSDLDDLQDLAMRTYLALREPIKFEPPGPKLKILLTDDINPKTGKAYPDYLERRERRRKAKQGKEIYAACIEDVRPDE